MRILKDSAEEGSLVVSIAGKVLSFKVEGSRDGITFSVELNGRELNVSLESDEATVLHREHLTESEGPIEVIAPMAGKIVSIKTTVGARVSEGEVLAVLEAMKMENEIAASRKGTVEEVYTKTGSLVKAGDKLVLIR